MKATGVVRRIDELGRIVIPKEIRKNLKIRDGESIEIFTDNSNQIILKKYSLSEDYNLIIKSYLESIYATIKKDVLVTDRDKFISGIGEIKREYDQKDISDNLLRMIDKREAKIVNDENKIELINNKTYVGNYLVEPIISSGECIGLFIVLSKNEKLEKVDEQAVKIAANFLGKYIEN